MNKEQKERAEALRLFDQGTPVAIEDEALRGYLQGHRWGYHGEGGQASPHCPACERQIAPKSFWARFKARFRK